MNVPVRMYNTKPSVSYICRHLGINRQQFAKYLDGRSLPSLESAIRIAEFFKVDLSELVIGKSKLKSLPAKIAEE